MNRQQTAIAKRAQIIALHDEGLSSRVIAQRLAVSRTTVQKWIHRHEEIGNLLDAERRPRPRLTSRAQDEAIQQAVRDDPFTNAVSIRKRLRLNLRPSKHIRGGQERTCHGEGLGVDLHSRHG
ncbi:hypothetical protein Pcinc_022219 [Petrolisthes cinctipes]|uniref:Uncharacterized protein n=1 Tax=Petrolisthes cinctipes TaxID=88211 RepID=A0AAE1FFX4_PETCI|nr:hypothetical protein Pcinc_041678 [Petrolisthes cinctipes]KAK3872719.1 hypothetical protein Pcinc_022219 [Petrolisthes cinctipes]